MPTLAMLPQAACSPFAWGATRRQHIPRASLRASARPRAGRQGWSPRRANAQRLPSQTLAIDRFLACLYGRSRRTSVAVVGRDKPSKLPVRSAADRPRNVPRLRARCARIGIPLPCAPAGAQGGAGIGVRTPSADKALRIGTDSHRYTRLRTRAQNAAGKLPPAAMRRGGRQGSVLLPLSPVRRPAFGNWRLFGPAGILIPLRLGFAASRCPHGFPAHAERSGSRPQPSEKPRVGGRTADGADATGYREREPG